MRPPGLRRRDLAGPPQGRRGPGTQGLPLGPGAAGQSRRLLRRREPQPHHRHHQGARGTGRRRRHLLRHRLRGGGRGGLGAHEAAPRGLGRHGAGRTQLLRAAQLRHRSCAVARPAGRPPRGQRRGHHHDVLQRRVQPHHAAARPADRLHGLARQPAEVRPQRRHQALRAPGGGHGDRALPRDDARPEGLPGGSRRRPRAGQADRRRQDRPLAGRPEGGGLAHGLAGRLGRARERPVRAPRRGARRLAGGAGRGAEAAARRGSAHRAGASAP